MSAILLENGSSCEFRLYYHNAKEFKDEFLRPTCEAFRALRPVFCDGVRLHLKEFPGEAGA
jgi:hypothetical protein